MNLLEEYVKADGVKYMKMNAELNSRSIMAMKQMFSRAIEHILVPQMNAKKDHNPGLAARMSTWDMGKSNGEDNDKALSAKCKGEGKFPTAKHMAEALSRNI